MVTFVFWVDVTFCLSLRKMNIMIGTVIRAPSSTAKKMPGLPCIQKKLMKSMPA